MSDDAVFALYIVPQADKVVRSKNYPYNWEQSPVSNYIGGELYAFVTDDEDDDEFNEVGTSVFGALTFDPRDIYGTLGVVRHGEALDELDIAFVEALVSNPDVVEEMQPPAGDINLIATTLDWRTLSSETIPTDGSAPTPEWAIDGAPYVADGYMTLDAFDTRMRVALVERENIEAKHLHGYLDDRFGDAEDHHSQAKAAAHAYRESEHWRLATWTRILTEARSEASIASMLKAAADGVPDEYLFAATD